MSIARKTYTLAIRDLFDPRVLAAGAEAVVKHGVDAAGQIASDAAGKIAGDTVKNMIDRLRGHFTDESHALTEALQAANDQAWKTIEVALAGPSLRENKWFASIPTLRTSGTDRSLIESFRDYLASSVDNPDFCRACLKDLRHARESGFITRVENFRLVELVDESSPFARFVDTAAILKAENDLVTQIAADFRNDRYARLGELLSLQPLSGQSLLAVAARHHFGIAVDRNERLRQKLQMARIEQIDNRLQHGFSFLAELQATNGSLLEETLDGIAGLAAISVETRDTVREIQRQLRQFFRSKQLDASQYTYEHSITYSSEQEKRFILNCKTLYRSLPAPTLHENPDLMIEMAHADIVVGNLTDAIDQAVASVEHQPDAAAKANAHHTAYRAALQAKNYPKALEQIQAAVRLDPFRQIWPHEYPPRQILGSGGFGVALLCGHWRLTGQALVVKSFEASALDQDIDTVLAEADTIHSLLEKARKGNAQADPESGHAHIIDLKGCGFVHHAEKRNPYLLLEYLEGSQSLESFVKVNGTFTPETFAPIAVAIARGLRFAHRHGVLHRDVKPGNILVRKEVDGWTVKLIDFGMAAHRKVVSDTMSRSRVSGGPWAGHSSGGAIEYAAPEQWQSDARAEIGHHSDVYGFGKTCTFSLFGTPVVTLKRWKTIDEKWAELLSDCTECEIGERLADFDHVLERLHAIAAIKSSTQTQAKTKTQTPPPAAHVEVATPAPLRVDPAPPKKVEQKPVEPRVEPETTKPVEPEPGKTKPVDRSQPVPPPSPSANQPKPAPLADTGHTETSQPEPEKKSIFSKLFRSGDLAHPPAQPSVKPAAELASPAKTVSTPSTGGRFVGSKAGDRAVLMLDRIEIPLRWCPPGTFLMGSPKTDTMRREYEDQVSVTLTEGFWLMETPVTQGLWQAVTGQKPQCSDENGLGPNHPAYSVDWNMANDFAAKLTQKLVSSGQLPQDMKLALPTEAQWEYACRAGTTTRFPFGDDEADLKKYAWFEDNSGKKTHSVSEKTANAWGLHDMIGNVWEWCADWYDTKLSGGIDPVGPVQAADRVLRGGSWGLSVRYCRAASRLGGAPGYRYVYYGFRLAAVR